MMKTRLHFLLRFFLMTSALAAPQLTESAVRAETYSNLPQTQIAQTDRWTTQVRTQLFRAALALGYGNYTMTHNPFIGDLGRRGQDDVTLNLRKGTSYAIVGVCDNDCRDIDIVLYDDNGNVVASDTKNDDTPVVTITPRWNAQFTIRVVMSSCSNAPCRYGVGAFGQ